MSHGWAIQQDGEILVESVSPTRQAAIVNWLIVSCRVAVYRDATADQIEKAFADFADGAKAEAIAVQITKVLHL